MRPIPALVGLLALAGCATTPSLDPGARQPTRVIESGGTAEVFITPDGRPVGTVVLAPRDKVWPALIQAYQEVGIPVNSIDERSGMLGNRSFEVTRRLAGKQLSNYFSCGTNLAGDIANSSRVKIDILSQLRPQDGGTLVETRVLASARTNEGTSTNATVCGSTGRLEDLIMKTVQLRAAG